MTCFFFDVLIIVIFRQRIKVFFLIEVEKYQSDQDRLAFSDKEKNQ
jgi:hypothetical protein